MLMDSAIKCPLKVKRPTEPFPSKYIYLTFLFFLPKDYFLSTRAIVSSLFSKILFLIKPQENRKSLFLNHRKIDLQLYLLIHLKHEDLPPPLPLRRNKQSQVRLCLQK